MISKHLYEENTQYVFFWVNGYISFAFVGTISELYISLTFKCHFSELFYDTQRYSTYSVRHTVHELCIYTQNTIHY